MAVSNRCLLIRLKVLRTFDQFLVSTVHTSVASPDVFTRNSHLGCVTQMISEFGKELRSPLTAGKECTMSPSEPSRTTRILGSAMLRLAHSLQQLSRRMLLGIADNRHANAQLLGSGPLRNRVRSVVRSLRVHVRSQFSKQRVHIRLGKNHYVINFAKRRNQPRASALVQHRATRALQTTHSGVGIHSHHKSISLSASARQIPHVSYVQDVKAPVREHNFLALLAQFLRNPRQILAFDQFCVGGSHVSATTAGYFSAKG